MKTKGLSEAEYQEYRKELVKEYHKKKAGITLRVDPDVKADIDKHIAVTGEGLTEFLLRAAMHQIHLDEMQRRRNSK